MPALPTLMLLHPIRILLPIFAAPTRTSFSPIINFTFYLNGRLVGRESSLDQKAPIGLLSLNDELSNFGLTILHRRERYVEQSPVPICLEK